MYKPTAFMIAMALTLSTATAGQHIFPNCVRGDLDGDFTVTLQDIEKIEDYIQDKAVLSCHQVMHADANRDWSVDEQDIESLLLDHGQSPHEYSWGDIDGNGTVNLHDLWLLEEYVIDNDFRFFPSIGHETGDISGDGVVNQLDLDIFLLCEEDRIASPFRSSPY